MLYFLCIITAFFPYYMCVKILNFIFPDSNKKSLVSKLFALVITITYLYYSIYIDYRFEGLIMLVFIVAYFLTFKFLLEIDIYSVFYRCFLIFVPMFSIRLFVISVLSLYNDILIVEYVSIPSNRFLITIYSFLAQGVYLLFLYFCYKITNASDVLKNKHNFQVSVYLLSIFYLYLAISSTVIYNSGMTDVKLIYFAIKTAVCILIVYPAIVHINYLLSGMLLSKFKFQNLSKELKLEQANMEKLQVEASMDAFTGLKLRDTAFVRIEHYLDDKEPFYVIFFDMNLLKTVNDKFGHEEGDFYILQVVEVIKKYFSSNTIARLGGDEFLVIGKFNGRSYKEIEKDLLHCDYDVHEISAVHKKEYETSVSYGFVAVDCDYEEFSSEVIIKLADERMYIFKREMKKERSVINLTTFFTKSQNTH